ncbi:MAG: C40 family peptidase [Bacillota bacterium]|nr:C40 family peptidase [Bacillota bacterium]
MKRLKNIKWPVYLLSIVSVTLLVTIVTAAPSTIAKETYTKQPPAVTVTAQPVSTTTQKSDPATQPTVVAANKTPSAPNPSLSTPANQRQTQQSRPVTTSKSSRSISTSSSISSQKVSAIIATSKKYIGVPYVFGGTTPAGFDCSGFVGYVFSKNGISLPRNSRDQFKVGTSVSRSNLKPGDLVFFSMAKNGVIDHMGIYLGNNQFINAASSKGVTIYTMGPYWQSSYVGAKRVI